MKVSDPSYLVDAGPIAGLFNLKDQWHAWSVAALTVIDEPLSTTETAWAEVCHLLGRDRRCLHAAIDAIQEGRIVLHSGWRDPARLKFLLQKYPQMDAGDASLVVLSEKFPRAKLITVDVRDFTVYRRFRDERLPLIHP